MHHPTDRITHTTAFVTPVMEHWLEREIAQWVHPMKDRSNERSTSELRPAPKDQECCPGHILNLYRLSVWDRETNGLLGVLIERSGSVVLDTPKS